MTMLEFFAGSGLVAQGLGNLFKVVWANDICPKKAAVYRANHDSSIFHLGDICEINGDTLPKANLAWASFPCQDLSLAGLVGGIEAKRSGMVWQWLRIMDEMSVKPKVLVAENVVGLISTAEGKNYQLLHQALHERGYRVGAIVLNAMRFVPQSRPRVFIVAVDKDMDIPFHLTDDQPNWLHPAALKKVAYGLPGWVWWHMPIPSHRYISLADIIEWDAPVDSEHTTQKNLDMMPERHRAILEKAPQNQTIVATGYKRTRHGKQVLEVRFDGIAGCLRTPEGGSSRQLVIIKRSGQISTRLLTVREAARLMGVPDSFVIPGGYNEGYKAMGDAVAVPVAEYLGQHLLFPLVEAAYAR
ncbi:DNA cytosine methyltransferase [Sporomusa carbonis]|uniref:DNA cytosine methyltransferase n=1 Tax=Sporomusa carbonis TaxID=3076075 RepID=UPI003C798936